MQTLSVNGPRTFVLIDFRSFFKYILQQIYPYFFVMESYQIILKIRKIISKPNVYKCYELLKLHARICYHFYDNLLVLLYKKTIMFCQLAWYQII